MALIIFALIRLAGFRVGFEPAFKVLATVFVMLPVVIMSILIVFVIDVGACLGVLLTPQLTGFLQASDVADRYVHLGLLVLIAMAPAFLVIVALCQNRTRA